MATSRYFGSRNFGSEVYCGLCRRQESCPPTDWPSGSCWVDCCGSSAPNCSRPPPSRATRDLREPHLHIFGNVGIDGIRLTELAARAQLSLATTSELVSDLQRLGYLERRPDPADRRAKLIFPTARGRQALHDAGNRVAEIEQHWSNLVGESRFAEACSTMQAILDELGRNNTD